MTNSQPLSKLGPGADFIGAGDEVAIIIGGRIDATGIVVDIAEDGRAIVNAETEDPDAANSSWTQDYAIDDLAHIDSPAADAAAMFGEDVTR